MKSFKKMKILKLTIALSLMSTIIAGPGGGGISTYTPDNGGVGGGPISILSGDGGGMKKR